MTMMISKAILSMRLIYQNGGYTDLMDNYKIRYIRDTTLIVILLFFISTAYAITHAKPADENSTNLKTLFTNIMTGALSTDAGEITPITNASAGSSITATLINFGNSISNGFCNNSLTPGNKWSTGSASYTLNTPLYFSGAAVHAKAVAASVTLSSIGCMSYQIINNAGSAYACTGQGLDCTTHTGVCEASPSLSNCQIDFAAPLIYVGNVSTTVAVCSLNSNGTPGTCSTAGSSFGSPRAIAILNVSGTTYVYVADQTNSSVSKCSLNTNGTFNTCTPQAGLSAAPNAFPSANGIAFNLSGTRVYVTNFTASTITAQVTLCSVGTNGDFSGCALTAPTTLTNARYITLNAANTKAYIPDSSNARVNVCDIDTSNGALSNCRAQTQSSTPFRSPRSVAINPANTFAYVVNQTSTSTISQCPINTDGTFGTCVTVGSGFSSAEGITLNAAGTIAYITNNTGTNHLSVCPVKADGTFDTCTSTTDSAISSPFTGIALKSN